MSLISDSDLTELFKQKDIYLDNDFLCRLSKDPELFLDFSKFITNDNSLKIDLLTEFEFKRDIYNTKQLKLIEYFLSKKLFHFPKDSSEILEKIKINAIILSKIYKIKNNQNFQTDNKKQLKRQKGPSIADFFLGGRLMIDYENKLLITGNKKDFPHYIFNINHILNTEDPLNGKIYHFFILSFNREKFDICFNKLNKINGEEINPLKINRSNLEKI